MFLFCGFKIKLESYKVIDELLRIDVDLEELRIRSTTIKYLLQVFLNKTVIPHMVTLMNSSPPRLCMDSSNESLTVETQAELVIHKLGANRIQSVANVASFIFMLAPFNCLVNSQFLPRGYEFFTESLVDPITNSQVYFSYLFLVLAILRPCHEFD